MRKDFSKHFSARSPVTSGALFERVIVGLLTGLLILPQLALGAIASWARLSLFLVAVVLFALWILQAARSGSLHIRRDPIWFFLLAFWGLLLLQVLPLPGGAVSLLSGIAQLERLDRITLSGGGHSSISISPYDSRMSMLRIAAFTLIFFVAANTIRRRGEVKLLLLALIAAGTSEVLFGFSGYFSGQRYPFWIAGNNPLLGVMGTFPHKNYFSGFLEMIVPVAIGFIVFLGRERVDGWESVPDRPISQRFFSSIAQPSFFQQIILAISVVVMIAGIAFSLSRAGIFIIFVIFAVFLVLIGFSRLSKKYVLAIVVIGGLATLAGISIGMDKVISGVEDAGSRQSGSWLHRWDMTRSAIGIVRDFPIFGTGLGTTEQVFTRYQSSQHADLKVRYFHNDILQLCCETGVAGWLIFTVGGIWFLARAVLNLRRRRDPFSKWVGTGALLGVGAMLLHSFFEHNLGKVTSNGIVFTELLAVAWICSRGIETRSAEDGKTFIHYDVRLPVLRGALVVGSVAVCVLAFVYVLPLIRAELALNRYLTSIGRPDPNYFLPASGEKEKFAAGPRIALALAPSNHRTQYTAAIQFLTAAEETVRNGAVALLGFEQASRDDKDVDKIIRVLLKNLPPGMAAARMAELSAAMGYLDVAVRLAPAMADYHFLRGITLNEIGGASSEVFKEAETAVYLAPKVPRILFGVGILFLNAGLEKTGAEREVLWSRARTLLRESLEVDPSYDSQVFPVVLKAFGVKGLIEVTPPTIRASEALYLMLVRENRWEEALTLLFEIERLASVRFKNEEVSVLAHDEEVVPGPAVEEDDMARIGKGFDQRTEEVLRRSLIQREALLMGRLGRWQERSAAVARYRRILREDSNRKMQDVSALRRQGRSGEALRLCQVILEQDWSCSAALLEAAELSTLPGVRTDAALWNDTLDHLYRLVLYNEELATDDVRRLRAIIDLQIPRNGQEKIRKEFVAGAAEVLNGRPEEGIRILQQLSKGIPAGEMLWGQWHLLWYYLGRGQEKVGKKDEAISSYLKAADLVPNHIPSLRRLAALRSGSFANLARLEPAVKLDIPFDGRITLLGYSLERSNMDPRVGTASITLFWQFTERMEARFKPMIRIGGFNGNQIFANRNVVMKGMLPYQTDAPKSGEVVTESYSFPSNQLLGTYLKVAFMAPGSTQSLYNDLDNGFIALALK